MKLKIMSSKRRLVSILALLAILFAEAPSCLAEDWKGNPDTHDFSVGFLGGLGVADSVAGISLLGTLSRKLVEPGFAPDINNGVSVEVEFGPFVAKGGGPLFYSAHLRWDFRKDSEWTLYALGGFAGYTSSSSVGNPFEFFPRFGIGTLWNVAEELTLRGEVSHELMAVGVLFPF